MKQEVEEFASVLSEAKVLKQSQTKTEQNSQKVLQRRLQPLTQKAQTENT